MADYISKDDVVSILEERQKETCPVGRYGRAYARDTEAYDYWQELIDAVNDIPIVEVGDG